METIQVDRNGKTMEYAVIPDQHLCVRCKKPTYQGVGWIPVCRDSRKKLYEIRDKDSKVLKDKRDDTDKYLEKINKKIAQRFLGKKRAELEKLAKKKVSEQVSRYFLMNPCYTTTKSVALSYYYGIDHETQENTRRESQRRAKETTRKNKGAKERNTEVKPENSGT